jgi:hypothetical protein
MICSCMSLAVRMGDLLKGVTVLIRVISLTRVVRLIRFIRVIRVIRVTRLTLGWRWQS